MSKDLEETKKSRKSIYGDYYLNIQTKSGLLDILERDYRLHHPDSSGMPTIYKHFFWDICNKLCRLACTPNHIDSWHDIAGYAQRIEETIENNGEGV